MIIFIFSVIYILIVKYCESKLAIFAVRKPLRMQFKRREFKINAGQRFQNLVAMKIKLLFRKFAPLKPTDSKSHEVFIKISI